MTDHDLQMLLARYRPAAPDAALRSRIVSAARAHSRWLFLESMAAILLVGFNLSLIAASVTQLFPSRLPPDPKNTEQLAAAIQQLDLPLSPQEAHTLAQQLAAGQRLVRVPLIHGPADTRFPLLSGGIP